MTYTVKQDSFSFDINSVFINSFMRIFCFSIRKKCEYEEKFL